MTDLAIKLFSAVLLLSTCHTDGDEKPANSKVEAVRTDSLAILLKQWKDDSLGCDHVRTIESFERLLNGYSLAQKNEAEMLKVLGPPNAEEKYAGNSISVNMSIFVIYHIHGTS